MQNGNVVGIFITDTHLKKDNVDLNKSIWKQAFNYSLEYNCPLFHGGDIFDSRTSQP